MSSLSELSKLTDGDLNELGNRFARAYYTKQYSRDYEGVFGHDTDHGIYDVEDTWESFECIAPVLDGRYDDWLTRNVELKARSGPNLLDGF